MATDDLDSMSTDGDDAGAGGDALDDLDALIADAQAGESPDTPAETDTGLGLDLDALASMPLPAADAAGADAGGGDMAMVGDFGDGGLGAV